MRLPDAGVLRTGCALYLPFGRRDLLYLLNASYVGMWGATGVHAWRDGWVGVGTARMLTRRFLAAADGTPPCASYDLRK